MVKVYEWKCEKCGRVIHSIYEEQFIHNKEEHIKSHEKENEK